MRRAAFSRDSARPRDTSIVSRRSFALTGALVGALPGTLLGTRSAPALAGRPAARDFTVLGLGDRFTPAPLALGRGRGLPGRSRSSRIAEGSRSRKHVHRPASV